MTTVFEITSERLKKSEAEAQTAEREEVVRYVTCSSNDMWDVVLHSSKFCLQHGEQLRAVRNILTISRHIDPEAEVTGG